MGKNALPFHPTIDLVYEALSANLRETFQVVIIINKIHVQNYLHFDRDMDSFRFATDKKSKASVEKIVLQNQILTQMIDLFRKDPGLVLWHCISDQLSTVLTDVRLFLTGMCYLLPEEAVPIDSTIETLLEFHKLRNIELWLPQDVMRGFWDISSHGILCCIYFHMQYSYNCLIC